MIRISAVSQHTVIRNISLPDWKPEHYDWTWIDFSEPSLEEATFLHKTFGFHPLAIEDCLEGIQRPKWDFYVDYHFFVLHHLTTEKTEEVDVFLSDRYIVTYHKESNPCINHLWLQLPQDDTLTSSPHRMYQEILDKLVDSYFPHIYQVEDALTDMEDLLEESSSQILLERLYDNRRDLSRLRRTVVPMRDLLYRMINARHLKKDERYFHDVYDHLLHLSEMTENNREISSDIRDTLYSLNAYHMNRIMKTLTVYTAMFMPLTFFVGFYGMNFQYMPELQWEYGYFAAIGFMIFLSVSMSFWFHKRGWFR